MDKNAETIAPHEIADLINRCASGDDASQADFYNIYYEFLRKAVTFAIRKYPSTYLQDSDTQELTHDIFIAITRDNYAALRRLHTPSSINAWLMRVARNHILSRLRKADVQNRAYQNATREASQKYSTTPEDVAIDAEQQLLLRRILDTLSPQERLMLNLYYMEGRKYSEIAEILHIHINTVASRLHRCKASLRTKLKDHAR